MVSPRVLGCRPLSAKTMLGTLASLYWTVANAYKLLDSDFYAVAFGSRYKCSLPLRPRSQCCPFAWARVIIESN